MYQTPSRQATLQVQPIPGSDQQRNEAGGYSWAVDDWKQLDRFLILGAEGSTYYAAEQALKVENANSVIRCVKKDGIRAIQRIMEISHEGRAAKNESAIFALALAYIYGDIPTRRAVADALPQVCRIGTHLFHFVEYLHQMPGWGRSRRRMIAKWYTQMKPDDLAYQVVKYQQRDGWSHRDLLRLSHPLAPSEAHNAVLKWIVYSKLDTDPTPEALQATRILRAFEAAKTVNKAGILQIISEYQLPREAIPTRWLSDPDIWQAMLPHMGLTALLRNLGTLSKIGLLSDSNLQVVNEVIGKLTSPKLLRQARIHPIAVLNALLTYQQGKGERSKAKWPVINRIVDALNDAFYAAFGAVEPSGKRLVLAVDVSSSMDWGTIAAIPGLSPRLASAAMALVTAATEQHYHLLAFAHSLIDLPISPRDTLWTVAQTMRTMPFGGTDCALPMQWALDNHIEADAFIIYTDSQTWAGQVHPAQALQKYRQKTGIPAKLIVVAMLSNRFSIADPNDAGMLDIVGFDTTAPQLISDFAAGRV